MKQGLREFLENVRDHFDSIAIRVERDGRWYSRFLNECTPEEVINWMIEFIETRDL